MKRVVRKMRKHWLEYPADETCYGRHKHGYGVYHLQGLDYWLDWESATDYEKEKYKAYLKSKGYKEKDPYLPRRKRGGK